MDTTRLRSESVTNLALGQRLYGDEPHIPEQLLCDKLELVNVYAPILNAASDLETIFHAAYECIRRLVDAPRFVISFYDTTRQALEPVFAISACTRVGPPALGLMALGEGAHRAVILSREPRLVLASPEHRGYATALYLPLVTGEGLIGIVELHSRRTKAYDEPDIAWLRNVANHVAAAIQRIRLSDETRRLADQLAAFTALASTVNEWLEVEQMTKRMLGVFLQITNTRLGSVHLLAPNGQIRLVAEFGAPHWIEFFRDTALADHPLLECALQMNRISIINGWFERGKNGGEPDDVSDDVSIIPLRVKARAIGFVLVGLSEAELQLGDPEFLQSLADQGAQALDNARLFAESQKQAEQLAATLHDLQESYEATLLVLSAALDARDHETKGHSQRVTRIAVAIAREMQLSEPEIVSLERGALLHDVGKIGISDNILLKPGPLTSDERRIMNEHPRMGYEMLRGVRFLDDALPVVLYHQEKYDGTGYPTGLRGQEIPLAARIFAVADAYDAMTSHRPYRGPMSHERALTEIIRCDGKQFDPQVVAAFLRLLAKENPDLELM